MKKFVKYFALILIAIIVVLIILFVSKYYKVNRIINLMKYNQENIDNYSYNIDNIDYKRNKDIFMYKYIANNNNFCFYYDRDKDVGYIIDDKNKTYYDNDGFLKYLYDMPGYKYLTLDFSFKNKLKLVFDWKIDNYTNDTYEITTKDNCKVIVDKETGYVLKMSKLSKSEFMEDIIRTFEVNSVTDKDVELPNLDEYTKMN